MNRRAFLSATVALLGALVVASYVSARTLPTVDQLMGDGKHCPNGMTVTRSVAFQESLNVWGRTTVVAEENMDGSWSVDPVGLVYSAVYAGIGYQGSLSWPVRVLLAYPFLNHQSFAAAEQINSDPRLFRCDQSA